MRLVFVMDPVDTVIVDEDTSFALMLEAQARGHRVDWCRERDVELIDGRARAAVRRATMDRAADPPIDLAETELVDLADDVDAVFIRKDPPFDAHYHWLTLVLEHLRGQTLVVNDPQGLRNANEKLYACHFPELMPRTLVAADKARIKAFLEEVGGRGVIKPIDGHGGEGIFALSRDDKNLNGLIEAVTHAGRRSAMVQAFIPEVTEGDKRILLMDGQILGAILRVPQKDDVRSNIHVGGSVVATEITDADRHIVETLTPMLRADGLWFVGLDVIGGKLTEVNVTSPTGIQQMSRLSDTNCEAPVLDWLEEAVENGPPEHEAAAAGEDA
ncbi:MAG TPA: glutathione synthase [Polyangiaceae bacterium LLY-WYZ-15_(1-7)]|nr:glutathione synthase [Polyangiaceae bacterium LLY-WYZ-15_(1-7)]HJL00369.1 glutathione synthase [Polyangiaceae bacterium LLY-WYZ-15_(1-7)]HJL10167.1 glutathione synthase [Polyangiaceae bacterium LLY-WYZ-15_(1-7)]HJL20865.1 glutathione synthase [Polyangiaceae bacterium LLY-WYZ-15_(1-7)]HJL33933.1 glutathione synthase [Polyangiaceae bacterium LLY-WYZ-15_(1-7)]